MSDTVADPSLSSSSSSSGKRVVRIHTDDVHVDELMPPPVPSRDALHAFVGDVMMRFNCIPRPARPVVLRLLIPCASAVVVHSVHATCKHTLWDARHSVRVGIAPHLMRTVYVFEGATLAQIPLVMVLDTADRALIVELCTHRCDTEVQWTHIKVLATKTRGGAPLTGPSALEEEYSVEEEEGERESGQRPACARPALIHLIPPQAHPRHPSSTNYYRRLRRRLYYHHSSSPAPKCARACPGGIPFPGREASAAELPWAPAAVKDAPKRGGGDNDDDAPSPSVSSSFPLESVPSRHHAPQVIGVGHKGRQVRGANVVTKLIPDGTAPPGRRR